MMKEVLAALTIAIAVTLTLLGILWLIGLNTEGEAYCYSEAIERAKSQVTIRALEDGWINRLECEEIMDLSEQDRQVYFELQKAIALNTVEKAPR